MECFQDKIGNRYYYHPINCSCLIAHCSSTSVMLQPIYQIKTAQRKRPHPTNFLEYASRSFGLNMSEGQESLNSLMMLRTVYNKPTAAGFTSLFIRRDNGVNNSE